MPRTRQDNHHAAHAAHATHAAPRARDSPSDERDVPAAVRAPGRRGLMALVAPSRCALCGEWTADDAPTCTPCRATGRRARILFDTLSVRAGWMYGGDARLAVHRLKFSGETWRGEPLGRALAFALGAPPAPSTVVVPVPLSNARARHRGYNQAGLLARGLAAAWGLELRHDLVARVEHGGAQHERRRHERTGDRGTYRVVGQVAAPILIVDDVCTTGRTMSGVAAALLDAGCAAVSGAAVCWTFARD